MASLIRRSPRNITTSGVYSATPIAPTITRPGTPTANPYLAGKTPKEQSDLAKRTAYLQPKAADLAKGNFAQFGQGITSQQYASQATSLSAAISIGAQTGVKVSAASPAPRGKGSVTPESFSQFRRDIELEEMFGMFGSGSAANIRLAQAQTGAPTEKLIAAENKRLGMRQEQPIGKAAFQYQGKTFDVEGNLVGQAETPSKGLPTITAPSTATVTRGEAGAGVSKVGIVRGYTPSEADMKIVEDIKIVQQATAPSAVKTLDVTSLKTFQAPTPIYPKQVIKPVIDLGVAIREGREAAMRYPSYLTGLTIPGTNKTGKFAGLTYASLYEKTSSGELKLTAAGNSFRNLILAATPQINVRLR